MATEERTKEIFENLKNAVVEYDEDASKEWAQAALDEEVKVNDAIFDGLVSGMQEVGRLFEAQEYFWIF
jgi:methanogenic corrinoid protein MtbC1